MRARDFVLQAQIEIHELEHWVSEGWLLPQQAGEDRDFSQIDLARAHFIRDMRGMGVNNEGIPIILDLVDQLHDLRRALRALTEGRDERDVDAVIPDGRRPIRDPQDLAARLDPALRFAPAGMTLSWSDVGRGGRAFPARSIGVRPSPPWRRRRVRESAAVCTGMGSFLIAMHQVHSVTLAPAAALRYPHPSAPITGLREDVVANSAAHDLTGTRGAFAPAPARLREISGLLLLSRP